MEPYPTEHLEVESGETNSTSVWHSVTPFSKYAAMLLFIAMPFIGGYVGYHYAPEKVVEVGKSDSSTWALPEKQVLKEEIMDKDITQTIFSDGDRPVSGCDKHSFTVGYETGSLFDPKDYLGIVLPTFLGHVWSETSSGAASGIWQYCKNKSVSASPSTNKLFISLPYYVIPEDCVIKEFSYENKECEKNEDGNVPQIIGNGSPDFFLELNQQYIDAIEWEKLTFNFGTSSLRVAVYENNEEIRALVSTDRNTFIIRFWQDTYSRDFVFSYLSSIQELP